MVKTAGVGRGANGSKKKSEFGRSSTVFAAIQGGGNAAAKQAVSLVPAKRLKL